MILNHFQTFNFLTIFDSTLQARPENLDIMVLFLLLGAFGKSAQFPGSWLPERWRDQHQLCLDSRCNYGYCRGIYACKDLSNVTVL